MCRIIVVTGPSSVGKSELIKHVINVALDRYTIENLNCYQKVKRVITCTDREERISEINGVDYNFKTKEEFNKLISDDKLIEYTESNYENRTQRYGTPKYAISLDSSDVYLIALDYNGIVSLKEYIKNNGLDPENVMTTIYINTTARTRLNRMMCREKTSTNYSDKKIYDFCKRMVNDEKEINKLKEISDITINNECENDLNECKTFLAILTYGMI